MEIEALNQFVSANPIQSIIIILVIIALISGIASGDASRE